MAHGGLGGLEPLFYALVVVAAIVVGSLVLIIPCLVKANTLKQLGQTDTPRFRRLRRVVIVCLIISSPVFLILLVNPVLGILAVLAGVTYLALIIIAIRVLGETKATDWDQSGGA